MRTLLTILSIFISLQGNSQTIEDVDSLRRHILKNLDQYDSFNHTNKEISNEDAVRYDSACFYYNDNKQIDYIKWRERSHTFHIAGDGINIVELFFLNGKLVFQKNFFYQFTNPQWNLEPDLNKTNVRVIESLRKYYREDGSALMEYNGRKAKGVYEDRFTLLDSIPLDKELEYRWSKRCDECLEKDYLNIFRELVENDKK